MSGLLIYAYLYGCMLVGGISTVSETSMKASPPSMNSHFDERPYYFHESNVTLVCLAAGVPKPKYSWFFNGELLEASRKLYSRDTGKLVIIKPTWLNEGYYHCKANNKYGTAVTRDVHVQKADNVAWSKDTPKPEVVIENKHIVLKCRNKPRSIPTPVYSWHIDQSAEVKRSKRVAVDQDGNLHFINIHVSDSSEEKSKWYFCSSYNNKLNTRTYGSETIITVHKDAGSKRAPSIPFTTKSGITVAMGSDLELQCIPDGIPIPDIIWKRGDRVFKAGGRVSIGDFGRTMKLRSLRENEEGVYECLTTGTPPARKEIVVKVISRPIWIHRPTSLTVTEDLSVTMQCDARSANSDGFVSVKWLADGIPLKDGYNGKVLVDGTRLTLNDVRKPYDIMTLQCNVTNKYGYQISNAPLNVIRKTVVTTNMENDRLMKQGDVLEMRVNAEPDPLYLHDMKLEWRQGSNLITNKDTSQPIYISGNNLYVVSTNGTSEKEFQALMGNFTCTITIGVESARRVVSMRLYTENPPLPSVVRSAGFPLWIIGLICGSVLLIVLIILIVFFMYRNRGDVWRVEEKERKAGRDVEKELEQCVFPTLSRASHIPDEFKYPPDEAEQAAMSYNDDQQLIHDNSSGDFVEQELNIFDEDGSFIGAYDQSARPPTPEPPVDDLEVDDRGPHREMEVVERESIVV